MQKTANIIEEIGENGMSRFLVLIILTTLFSFNGRAHGGEETNASSEAEKLLRPLKLDSPRDTMHSFMEAMNAYHRGKKTGNKELIARIQQAASTFYLPETPYVLREEVGKEAAVFLKEVIDRVIIIDYDKIPNEDVDQWRLKGTEITIAKITEGDHKGQYLFSPSTAYRAKDFYQKVKHLTYLPDSGQGALYRPPWYEKQLPAWAGQRGFLLPHWQWLAILLAIFIGLLLKSLTKHIMHLIIKVTHREHFRWQSRALSAVERPAGVIVASAFWFFSVYVLKFEGLALSILTITIQIVFSAAAIWTFYLLVAVATDFMKEWSLKTETPLDDHLVPLAGKSLRIFVVIFGSLVMLQNLGFNVLSVLAGLGLGGLAFALAAKDTCANLFGSVMILLDRPFAIGDWIVAGGIEGTVEEIGFRSTRVRTFYNSVVSVPNSNIANMNIDNMGLRQYRRCKMVLGVTYDTSPEKIESFMEGIKEIIRENPHTRKDYFHVVFTGYGASALEIMVYLFFVTNDWSVELAAKQSVNLEILKLAEKLGVEFAFPTQTLHIESLPEN